MSAIMEWSTGTGEEVFPEDLATYAQQLCEKHGMRRVPGRRWGTDRGFVDAMQAVIDACLFAGWPPRRYVQAQVESLRLIIDRGARITPAHLVGAAADDRFQKWLDRARFRSSDVRVSADDKVRVAARKRAVAAQRFGVAHLVDGMTRGEAAAHVGHDDAPWDWRGADVGSRAVALCAALSALNHRYPHAVLAPPPEDGAAWKWGEIKRAFDAFLDGDPRAI